MPMIREAPAVFAPSATCPVITLIDNLLNTSAVQENDYSRLTARPTVPSPKIATIDPDSTFAVFQTAPRPKRQHIISGLYNLIYLGKKKRIKRTTLWHYNSYHTTFQHTNISYNSKTELINISLLPKEWLHKPQKNSSQQPQTLSIINNSTVFFFFFFLGGGEYDAHKLHHWCISQQISKPSHD